MGKLNHLMLFHLPLFVLSWPGMVQYMLGSNLLSKLHVQVKGCLCKK